LILLLSASETAEKVRFKRTGADHRVVARPCQIERLRVFLVEDNATFAQEVERDVRSILGCEIVWARSRDGALARIERVEDFDLVVLDRRLPTADDVLDDHPDHGWSVFQAIQAHSAGTPVWFLTGTVDADFATEINNDYARKQTQMVGAFKRRCIKFSGSIAWATACEGSEHSQKSARP
jgi:CheY-like chemotaxis protein